MSQIEQLVSPRRAAQALGVSESSLKRWCDRGLIQTVRTGGGHRKLSTAAVLRFVREHDYPLVAPELLGMAGLRRPAAYDSQEIRAAFIRAVLAGDEGLVRQILFELYLARQPLAEICDQIIAVAFQEIGARWACQEIQVYQERRGCEVCLRALLELRHIQAPPPAHAPLAIGGTLAGDPYSLPTTMIELVLRELGVHAMSLGVSIPGESLTAAIRELQPALFWLSASHIPDEAEFQTEFARLSAACQQQATPLVVGGQALTESLRRRLVYSAHCDTLVQLSRLVATFWEKATLRPASSASCGDPQSPHAQPKGSAR